MIPTLSDVAVTLGTSVTGAVGDVSVSLTTNTSLRPGELLAVVFPGGFDVAGSAVILHPTPLALHPTSYTLPTSCSPHLPNPTPYTLHPTPYTLHPTPSTLHPTPYTLHPTPYTPHPPGELGDARGGRWHVLPRGGSAGRVRVPVFDQSWGRGPPRAQLHGVAARRGAHLARAGWRHQPGVGRAHGRLPGHHHHHRQFPCH